MTVSRLVGLLSELPVTVTPVGKLAVRLYDRALGEGNITTPTLTPQELFALLLQLIQMLRAGGCFPSPVDATGYLNSQRMWRRRRIGREVRRGMTAYPQYGEDVKDSIVRSILFECRVCTVEQMESYYRTLDGFRDF